MVKLGRKEWKEAYNTRLEAYLAEYPKMHIVCVDNVGSHQMQQIRMAVRGKAEILMGKNTMIRRVFRNNLEKYPHLENLLPLIRGNLGFVFTKEDLGEIKELLTDNKVEAPAKAGALAPIDVTIPAGDTGLPPDKTSFFQALGITTKIARGSITIERDIKLITAGEKVGASEATLLVMLGKKPFEYGLECRYVVDNGNVFEASVLDISTEDIISRFHAAVANVAAVSLAIGYPTAASAPHSIANGFKNLLAIAAATDITFPLAEKTKAFLADPSAFVVAAPAAAAGGDAAPAAAAAAPVEEEESDEDMGFGLFD
jgi:large subunit ribosomal protein LP0